MPRMRRHIKSNTLYEISFRAREALPFPCTEYMRLIVLGIMARVLRDNKVLLHHFLWEISHGHFLCTAKDADECQRFYGELKKQITDAVKQLTGIEHLNLWEDRASVIEIPTLDDAVEKVSYIYANPSNDDLVSHIDDYPGISSWDAFQDADRLESRLKSWHKWIRWPMIEELPSRSVTPNQDKRICERLLKAARDYHTLNIYPNLWIKNFIDNPTDADVARILSQCKSRLEKRQEENCKRRAAEGKRVVGKTRLRTLAILTPHKPKKKGRRIFVQSMFKEVRIRKIAERKELAELCREIYELWKNGDFSIPWPPGTFPPPIPPRANCLQT